MADAKRDTLDQAKELELLSEVSQLLTDFDMHQVLGKVIRLVARSVGATRAHLALHPDFDLDWRQIFRTDQLSPDMVFSASVGGLETGLAGWVARERVGTIVTDSQTDERHALFDGDIPTGSTLALPLISNHDMMGVVSLSHPKHNHFTEDHLRLARIAFNQAAVAVYSARLENRVQARERQLEAVLHAIDDMVLVLDKTGQVLMMNTAVIRYMGMSRSRSQKTWYIHQLAENDVVFSRIQNILDTLPGDSSTWRFKARSDERNRDFEILMSMWENQIQGMSGYVIALHDVTTLLDLDRFKNDMLRMASHDLRSPLALISGYCDMVEMDLPTDISPSIVKYLEVIRKTTERMDNILNEMLRVEQIHTSPLELQQKVEILPLLQTVMDDMQAGAEQKHHQLYADFTHLPDGIQADKVMLREAMENFVSNAIKYTPDSGRIIVRAYGKDGRFHFEVEDNGIGIGQEHLDHLFKSFYRAKQPGTEHISGTGLGLSLVKAVIERHRGEVWVETKAGKGSTFGFWLPVE